jgi:hypothetical protein
LFVSYIGHIGNKVDIVTPKTPTINKDTIINGAKGISLFILWTLDVAINNNPTIAPSQKDKKKSVILPEIPTNHPIPRASFTSPKPISLPFDKNHKKKNGAASNIPANIALRKENEVIVATFQIIETKLSTING